MNRASNWMTEGNATGIQRWTQPSDRGDLWSGWRDHMETGWRSISFNYNCSNNNTKKELKFFY